MLQYRILLPGTSSYYLAKAYKIEPEKGLKALPKDRFERLINGIMQRPDKDNYPQVIFIVDGLNDLAVEHTHLLDLPTLSTHNRGLERLLDWMRGWEKEVLADSAYHYAIKYLPLHLIECYNIELEPTEARAVLKELTFLITNTIFINYRKPHSCHPNSPCPGPALWFWNPEMIQAIKCLMPITIKA